MFHVQIPLKGALIGAGILVGLASAVHAAPIYTLQTTIPISPDGSAASRTPSCCRSIYRHTGISACIRISNS